MLLIAFIDIAMIACLCCSRQDPRTKVGKAGWMSFWHQTQRNRNSRCAIVCLCLCKAQKQEKGNDT